MSLVVFQVVFSNQKTLSLGILFLCLLCVCYQVAYDLGVFQVRLDVLSLEKLEKITSFLFVLMFGVRFNLLGSFLQSSGFRCNTVSMLFW